MLLTQAGQWVYLKSAIVSKFEWHPFTLTSSPDDDYLECHIKAVGDWCLCVCVYVCVCGVCVSICVHP